MKDSPLNSRSKSLDFIPFEGESSERLLGVPEGGSRHHWVAQEKGAGTWTGGGRDGTGVPRAGLRRAAAQQVWPGRRPKARPPLTVMLVAALVRDAWRCPRLLDSCVPPRPRSGVPAAPLGARL